MPFPKQILLILLVCGGLVACAKDAVTGDRRYALVQWTPEQEREMGRENFPDLVAEFDAIHPNQADNELLRQVVLEMVQLSPRSSEFEFQFKILNSSIPNAVALPGGYMYITRGLLQAVESEAQFVTIMGHELGHVEHRHAMLNQSHGVLLGLPAVPFRVLANILPIGQRVVGGVATVIATPSILLGLKFSRDQELEADERGVFFAGEMGFDPLESKLTFEMFERLAADIPKTMADRAIFSTHPQNKDRIRVIEESAEEQFPGVAQRAPGSFRAESSEFSAVLERFRKEAPIYALYDRATRLMNDPAGPDTVGALVLCRRAGDLLPDEPLFHIQEGELLMLSDEVPAALEEFRTAIALYDELVPGEGHWKPHMYLGAYALKHSSPGRAATHLQRACELFPKSGESHLLLGLTYAEVGEDDAAVEEFRRAMELLPKNSEAYKLAREGLRNL